MSATGDDPPVLLVEADEPTRLVCAAHLREQGCPVLVATGPEEGLELAERHRPGVIVLASRLADADGWALLERLGDSPATEGVPVVMLVGAEEAADASAPWSAGAAAYLTRPFSPHVLSELISAVTSGVEDSQLR